MSYNIEHLSTAGRATIFTVMLGVACFALVFLLNLGSSEFKSAVAQDTATTSVFVVNLPPEFLVDAFEDPGSSTSSPTNSGDEISWTARGSDTNGEDYFLLICSTNATPTAVNSGPPACGAGAIQWARSATTSSGAFVTVSTTTRETPSSLFSESNDWHAFVCDANPTEAECSDESTQIPGVATSSPFNVNNPPLFSGFWNDGPVNPDGTLTFYATSSDIDTVGGNDTVRLTVCATLGFSTSTGCAGDTLATSTLVLSDPTASWTLTPPWQDTSYNSFPYIVDVHDHIATSSLVGATSTFNVNNVAPTVDASQIVLDGGTDIVLDQEAGETTDLTLDFVVNDGNSCVNTGSTTEITGYELSLYRDDPTNIYAGSNSSTTCLVDDPSDYNPNNCYTSAVATTTWNISCTASSTTCGGSTDPTLTYECTFPLWFVADPTDGTATSTQYPLNDWKAQVRAIDDNFATGTAVEDADGVDVTSFLAFDLLTFRIPFGSLAPGETSDSLFTDFGNSTASSTLQATGNVGIDTLVSGEHMCPGYNGPGTECENISTSTIEDFRQVFSTTSSQTYLQASTSGYQLSSSTDKEVEVDVFKSTSTSTPATGITYWGIQIPGSINVSGEYTGQNTFTVKLNESVQWGP